MNAGAAADHHAEGNARRARGDLAGAARCFLDAIAADPLRFDAGQALADAIAAEVRAGRVVAPPPRPEPAAPPMISVIVCSHRPSRFARTAEVYGRALAGARHEIVGIHDARSLCEGYNRGLRASRGEVLVLSHDDVDLLAPDFLARLVDALQRFDVVGPVGATRLAGPAWGWAGHPDVHGWIAHRPGGTGDWRPAFWSPWPRVSDAVVLDGALIAGRRHAFEAVRFDDATFDGFHCYDVDFSWRASRAGFSLGVCGDLCLVHESVGGFDAKWRAYADRLVAKFPECNGPQRPSHRYEVALPTAADALAFFLRLDELARAKLAGMQGRA